MTPKGGFDGIAPSNCLSDCTSADFVPQEKIDTFAAHETAKESGSMVIGFTMINVTPGAEHEVWRALTEVKNISKVVHVFGEFDSSSSSKRTNYPS